MLSRKDKTELDIIINRATIVLSISIATAIVLIVSFIFNN